MARRTPDRLISKAFRLLRRCKTLLVRLGKTLWSASWWNGRLLWFASCIRSWRSGCRFRDIQQRRQRQYSYSNKHCDSSDNRRGCTSCLEAVSAMKAVSSPMPSSARTSILRRIVLTPFGGAYNQAGYAGGCGGGCVGGACHVG